MLAVIWPLQRAVTLRDPIPMCAAASRRRRCTCSAFSSAITRYVEDAADRGDSGAAVLRVHGMIARTSVAGKMTVGGCNRALQGAAGALPRVADRTASWLARACLGLDCHELSWQSSRSYSRVRHDSRCSCTRSVRSTQPAPARRRRTRIVCGRPLFQETPHLYRKLTAPGIPPFLDWYKLRHVS